jgi:hypothetical protein
VVPAPSLLCLAGRFQVLKAWAFRAGAILIFAGSLSAQEPPLSVQGTLSSGFYSADTSGGGNGSQSIKFVPAAALLDIKGYYLTPDLLDVSVQPELDASPQASEAGFQGGNGVRTRVTLLRKRAFPLTLRYSNVQLEDVYFGSLSQVSSYTLKNRNKDLGFATELKRSGMPTAVIDWGTSSVDSKSGISANTDYQSHTRHGNVDSEYVRWGWDFKGFAHRQQQTSNLLTSVDQTGTMSTLEQKVTQYQASGRRSLPWDSELYVDGGNESTANALFSGPIHMTTRYASANLQLRQRRKWKTSLRSGYTSNIAGLLLTQLVGSLASNGSVAPSASVLQPLQRSISNLNLNALTSLDLSHGVGLYGSADRTAVLAAGSNNLGSTYVTTAGGMTYTRNLHWGSFSGQYGREFGIGSVTGQRGRIGGQNYTATVQRGTREGLQFDFSVHGTDQNVRNEQTANNRSLAWDGSVSHRLFGQIGARVGGGWQQSAFKNVGNDFHTNGYSTHASIEHPRLQVNASLNTSLGNSLQAYSQIFGGIGAEAALITPLHLVASDLRGTSFSLHATPLRKLELSALWSRSIQHLEGVVANDFEIFDAHATYHFRRLQFVSGVFRSYQTFSSNLATYPETQRGRFYVRVSRTIKFI